MYTVIGPTRTRTIRVLWLLQELGQEYEHVPAAAHSEEARNYNPSGKVPALLEGDHVFTDSVAIMTYLADKHGQFTMPAGSPERAVQDGHTQFVLDEFDACLWTASRHLKYLPEEHRVPGVIPSLKWEFERSQNHFVQRLGAGPFLMGTQFTIADMLAAHCGGWAIAADFPVTSDIFRDYITRVKSRPAFKRALGLAP